MTTFDTIYGQFLSTIQDYHIKNLFVDAPDVGEDLLASFLCRAVSQFKNCVKNIKSFNKDEKSFNVDLDIDEVNILSDLMVLNWMDWNANNVVQMNISLTDNDFKHFSEEKNLKEKTEYADRWREKVLQAMVDYGLYRTNYREWAVGNYGL